jgi:hypothetical protein
MKWNTKYIKKKKMEKKWGIKKVREGIGENELQRRLIYIMSKQEVIVTLGLGTSIGLGLANLI